MSKPRATRTKAAPKKNTDVVVNFGDACLDEDKSGSNLTLSVPLLATLKKLGSEECCEWYPTFTLTTKVGTRRFGIYSGTLDDDDLGYTQDLDEFQHPDETLNENSDVPLLVNIDIDDVIHTYDYDGFWDVIEALPNEKGKLSNFKFTDGTSGITITRKKLTPDGPSKTMLSLYGGKITDKKKGEEVVEKLNPLFELELKTFAEHANSEPLRLLAHVF